MSAEPAQAVASGDEARGLDADYTDGDGATALDLARRNALPDLAAILEQHARR